MAYGPRITAIIVYLYVGEFLSKKRTAAALAELFAHPGLAWHRRGDDHPRGRQAGWVRGVDAHEPRHRRGGCCPTLDMRMTATFAMSRKGGRIRHRFRAVMVMLPP